MGHIVHVREGRRDQDIPLARDGQHLGLANDLNSNTLLNLEERGEGLNLGGLHDHLDLRQEILLKELHSSLEGREGQHLLVPRGDLTGVGFQLSQGVLVKEGEVGVEVRPENKIGKPGLINRKK